MHYNFEHFSTRNIETWLNFLIENYNLEVFSSKLISPKPTISSTPLSEIIVFLRDFGIVSSVLVFFTQLKMVPL